jgi:DNA polymerase
MAERIPRATIDFESRSPCALDDCGTWRYSLDPRTEVLCLAFRLPGWEKGRTSLWHPAFPTLGIAESTNYDELAELFKWIACGKLVEAHNAFFERCIWKNKLSHWPQIADDQWMCSAAKAAAHALPRNLEKAIDALGLDVRKDSEGHALMKSMVKPRNAVKADWREWRRKHAPCLWCDGTGKLPDLKKGGEWKSKPVRCGICDGDGHTQASVPDMPLLYKESQAEMLRLFEYNRTDVLAEEGLSETLPDLSPSEQRLYVLDQRVNERGFQLDREAVDAALVLIDEECVDLNIELRDITEGAVERATQRKRMMNWFASQGLRIDDTQGSTLDELLECKEELPPWVCATGELPPNVRRAIELMRTLGRSSTAKYVCMRDQMDDTDDRVRGGLLFHGATTGRWTGKGVQPHNFPKAALYEEVP